MFNFDDMMNFMNLIMNEEDLCGEVIGTDTIQSYNRSIYIDTCFTNDTKKYETAIQVDRNDIVVVEEYSDADSAKIGHNKWIKICQQKEFSFYSIQDLKTYIYKM